MKYVNKLKDLADAINSYYALALIAYPALLFITSHTKLFITVMLVASPIMAGWGGYLLRSFVARNNKWFGFRIVTDVMTYEVGRHHNYTLHYATTVKADTNHLMIYPMGYHWTGDGTESVPVVTAKGQHLLSIVGANNQAIPYKAASVSTEGEWHYWFIALNPPVHKGQELTLRYRQNFHDKKRTTQPYLGYLVRTKMQKLRLTAIFPSDNEPKKVTGKYIKLNDPSRPYEGKGVVYDSDERKASWTILKPKKGFYYRIEWR
ncbi:MAG TPA: hypothetical protein VLG40_04620 [Candidatus Saccharimonas sp.]|nr:hypothetical protein [Candidatus Saccharimonas sp.]